MPELTGIWSLSPWGALVGGMVTAYLMVMYGWIVPRRTHERELAAERRRADEWKEAALKYEAVAEKKDAIIATLTEGARTSAHFFSAVPVVPKEESGHVDAT